MRRAYDEIMAESWPIDMRTVKGQSIESLKREFGFFFFLNFIDLFVLVSSHFFYAQKYFMDSMTFTNERSIRAETVNESEREIANSD